MACIITWTKIAWCFTKYKVRSILDRAYTNTKGSSYIIYELYAHIQGPMGIPAPTPTNHPPGKLSYNASHSANCDLHKL